jgi:phospholipid transport system substrate-binding protein
MIAVMVATLVCPMMAFAEELSDPMAVLKQNTEKIRGIVLKSETEEEMRENVKGLMEGFINFDEFGKLSLGKRWETLKEEQKKVYLVEFRGLLQRTYLRRFKPGKPFTVTYRSEVRYNKGKDRGEIKTTINSGDVEADVDYRFHKVETWQVYDLIVDDVSVMRNYRKSFIRVLTSDGFEALIEKMKKKTSEDVDE